MNCLAPWSQEPQPSRVLSSWQGLTYSNAQLNNDQALLLVIQLQYCPTSDHYARLRHVPNYCGRSKPTSKQLAGQKAPMRAWLGHRCSRQLHGTFSRLASSSSEAKALSQTTGKTPPTPPDSTTTVAGQAFPGDLRSTSGLGFGDNLLDHTSKWLQVFVPVQMLPCSSLRHYLPNDTFVLIDLQHAQPGQGGNETSPMEYVWRAEPIKVHGAVVASYGSKLHGVYE